MSSRTLILLGDDATPELRRATSLDALVTLSSPPFFVWHTAEDAYIPPEHTYRLAASLAVHGVPHCAHIFAHGPHSLGLAQGDGDAANWTTLAASCITEQLKAPSRRREQVSETTQVATYIDAETQVLRASNGVDYAYRTAGASHGAPLVALQHFRGNLDNWDPALIDALARGRRVITFDNRGVAASSGTTPSTIAQMALDALDFIDALEVGAVDLLGFSIGSFVAQEIALVRPSTVRQVVLASSAPQGASGMHGWAPEVIDAVGKPETSPGDYLGVFFTSSDAGRAAGQQVAGRVFGARTVDRDATTSWQTRLAQYDAVCAWGQPNHSLLERVSAIDKPVFVANGDSDPMILPRYSHLLAGLIPGARLKLYPDAAHGFLFQHHAEFAADVDAFLAAA